MSRLIINADDLGYTRGINTAVDQLYGSGALSSATAMASGDALTEAVAAVNANGLSVGGHIMFLDGVPVSPPEAIPSLVIGSRFRPTLAGFLTDLLRGRIRSHELEIEAAAQILRLQSLGLELTHVDTHKHTHMFPGVLKPLLRAATQCGVRAVRNPFEPSWARRATPGAPVLRRLEVAGLAMGRRAFLNAVQAAGMRTPAGALGVLATGVLSQSVLEALLGALARYGADEDTWELVCHPGLHDANLDALPTRLRAERERERAALLAVIPQWTAGRLKPSAQTSSHKLASFANL